MALNQNQLDFSLEWLGKLQNFYSSSSSNTSYPISSYFGTPIFYASSLKKKKSILPLFNAWIVLQYHFTQSFCGSMFAVQRTMTLEAVNKHIKPTKDNGHFHDIIKVRQDDKLGRNGTRCWMCWNLVFCGLKNMLKNVLKMSLFLLFAVVASERCFDKTPFMCRLLVVLASQLSYFQGDKKL